MSHTLNDQTHMQQALALARHAASLGEVPVGAVLVHQGTVVGEGYNQTVTLNDPTAHAEVVALRAAAKHLGVSRLSGTTLYVTLEPCSMCAGALINARVASLVYGAREPKTGAVVSVFELLMSDCHNHRVAIREGVLAHECAAEMTAFFRSRR